MAPAPKHSHQEQQQLILDAAAKCIEDTSLLDFTMSAISKEAGLSMGSIYKHIQSKEDVLVALATEVYVNLHKVFTQVMSLPVPYALRLIGLQMISIESSQLYSFDDHLEMLVANEAVLQRASSSWLEKMIDSNIAVETLCTSNISQAVEDGELVVTETNKDDLIEEIKLGCWSMHVGYLQVARQRYSRNLVGKGIELQFPLQVDAAIVQAQKRLINTYPWKQPVTDGDIQHLCRLMEEQGLR